ncbi:probable Protein VTS1 [Melanopsichium pennsylvanicum]|uniref:RNA-binding protein VTS1 n=2 Tax=Melanopsichium pennsylvanicum TaxID=63383 RepID=A0AAJ4XMD5_9BASI|nr:rna-binding protein involved in translational partial [Melanopsichium pennsylvanicum 4]SNX84880.1 probable Protein VTS1 [Melanopsichium pennsylvanicum]
MSDFGLLRSPLTPSNTSINRVSSPSGNRPSTMNPHSRYSLGKGASTEHMMRLAQQANAGHDSAIRSPSMGGTAAMSGTPASRNLRPSSEMLPNMSHHGTPETEAIDRWFEDLQHYEATLEEMAAASLDQNFKEELSAIEQWFRVLSEAERTAALYSLLQESTQVQIRFFITVLQQMARSDPVTALLSPSHHNSSMADQMEAKLATLGLKAPNAIKGPASPGARGYRQSSDAAGFLSPNVAAMYSPGNADAASTLAAQRAKLKANRTSAPGTLLGESRNYSGGQLDQVQERGGSPNPQQQQQRTLSGDHSSRPKSTDLSNSGVGRSPRASGPLDDQLSPITATGNWSSMVNTPLVPMFSDNAKAGSGEANVNLETAAAQLASLQQQHQAGGNGRVMVDPDVPRYRRKSNQNTGVGAYGQANNMYDQISPGVSPNIGMQSGWGQNDNFGRGGLNAGSSAFGGNTSNNQFNIPPMSPNALAGLQSPSGGLTNPLNLQMMNAMAAMGGLNLNNMNAAQFLAMQQQILQNQQTLSVLAQQQQMQQQQHHQQQQQQQQQGRNARAFGGGVLSPGIGGGNQAGRKSPRSGTSPAGRPAALPSPHSGAAGGEEEVADLATLEDVPAWLRQLRLHKYTPNFETSHWKDMVVMDDKALEDKGVAALGARRKMLKTFELVRKKYGIKMDGEDEPGSGVPGSHNDEKGEEAGEKDDAQEVDRELGGAGKE